VTGLGIRVAHADEVGGNAGGVVRIRLSVGHKVEFEEPARLSGFDGAEKDFVVGFVVILGFWNRDAIFVCVGEHHAIAVGLDFVVAFAVRTAGVGIDSGEKSAAGIAGPHVGTDALGQLILHGVADLDAVKRFTVGAVRFAADRVADAGL